jgi:hypothetical protein
MSENRQTKCLSNAFLSNKLFFEQVSFKENVFRTSFLQTKCISNKFPSNKMSFEQVSSNKVSFELVSFKQNVFFEQVSFKQNIFSNKMAFEQVSFEQSVIRTSILRTTSELLKCILLKRVFGSEAWKSSDLIDKTWNLMSEKSLFNLILARNNLLVAALTTLFNGCTFACTRFHAHPYRWHICTKVVTHNSLCISIPLKFTICYECL